MQNGEEQQVQMTNVRPLTSNPRVLRRNFPVGGAYKIFRFDHFNLHACVIKISHARGLYNDSIKLK